MVGTSVVSVSTARYRSFYVGKNVLAEDIKAEFKNGILKLNVPKDDSYDKVEKKDFISIAD